MDRQVVVRKTVEQWLRGCFDGDKLCVMQLKNGAVVVRNERTGECHFLEVERGERKSGAD